MLSANNTAPAGLLLHPIRPVLVVLAPQLGQLGSLRLQLRLERQQPHLHVHLQRLGLVGGQPGDVEGHI